METKAKAKGGTYSRHNLTVQHLLYQAASLDPRKCKAGLTRKISHALSQQMLFLYVFVSSTPWGATGQLNPWKAICSGGSLVKPTIGSRRCRELASNEIIGSPACHSFKRNNMFWVLDGFGIGKPPTLKMSRVFMVPPYCESSIAAPGREENDKFKIQSLAPYS